MELWQEIFSEAIRQSGTKDNQLSDFDLPKLLDSTCYIALKEIKSIIEDDTLEDEECFMRIEKIVCLLEKLGSNGGNRHDFG